MQSTRSQDLIVFNKKKLNHIAHLTIKSLQAFTLEGEGRLVIVMLKYLEWFLSVNMHTIF